MNRDRGFHPYYVVFEGNVALNPHSFPEIVQEVQKRLQNTALFAELGVPVPVVDLVQRPMREVFFAPEIPIETRKKMEISLIGTAILGITDAVLHAPCNGAF